MHTPDALEKCLKHTSDIRTKNEQLLTVVLWNRDKDKATNYGSYRYRSQ
jgi:hypothetical protein